MSVLLLSGKAINWAKPPKANAKVMWSKRDIYGRAVVGSLRTIAHLDHLDTLAVKKFGVGIEVMQGPFNTGVAASEGTHDYDACLDVRIPGVDWLTQQSFFRANGAAAYYRKPPAFTVHIHYFCLPPREGDYVNDDYRTSGFKVGRLVDGGWSLFGRTVASSQIEDYYAHRTALAGHAVDPTWFPPNIEVTIFDLNAYIVRQRNLAIKPGRDEIANLATHGPLARLGGEAGAALWEQWEGGVRKRANAHVRDGLTTLISADTNKRGALPNFGAAMRRIGGKGIDLIAVRRAAGGARVKVIKRKRVDLKIDGHDGYGVKVKVTFPSGRTVKFWAVQANLGRGVDDVAFYENCVALRKAFGANAVYNFNEIDEADSPREHKILREVFPTADFAAVGWATFCPTLVGKRRLKVVREDVTVVSPGLAKVSPPRVIAETVLAPK